VNSGKIRPLAPGAEPRQYAARMPRIDPTIPFFSHRSSTLRDLAWRTIFRIGYPLARLWWQLRCPRHEGALVVVYVGPALLMVRASYRAEWGLPGGGLQPGETPEAAARRELAEEIGLIAPSLHPAGIVCGRWDGRRDRVHFFELRLDQLPNLCLDNREIIAARLISPDELSAMKLTGPLGSFFAKAPALKA
jgi:8-oxo-dGTP diphosphatase